MRPLYRSRTGALLVAWIGVASAGAGAVQAAQIAGRVELQVDGTAVRTEELRRAVVYFKPKAAVSVRPGAKPIDIVMRRKEFVPRVVAVTAGSTVRFPNSDPILHNVFSVSGENAFDLGLYPEGPGKTVTFAHPGLVRVFCNVHHDMVAWVLVLDTPYFTTVGADGAFLLEGLPESEGLLVVWHERSEAWSRELRLPADEPVVVSLTVSKPAVPAHADKNGKPYATADGDAKSYR
jgi:plastocyanin